PGTGTAASRMPGCGSALLAHHGQTLGGEQLSTNRQFQLSNDAAERYARCGARYILGPCAPSLVDMRPGCLLATRCWTGLAAAGWSRALRRSGSVRRDGAPVWVSIRG